MKLEREESQTRLEMIPLLDVVFLLLVFFIYAMVSMVVHRGLPVNLPAAETFKDEKVSHVSVTVTSAGELMFEGETVSEELLVRRLEEARRDDPGLTVFVFGDRKSPYDAVVAALDSVRGAQITRVSLETRLKRE